MNHRCPLEENTQFKGFMDCWVEKDKGITIEMNFERTIKYRGSEWLSVNPLLRNELIWHPISAGSQGRDSTLGNNPRNSLEIRWFPAVLGCLWDRGHQINSGKTWVSSCPKPKNLHDLGCQKGGNLSYKRAIFDRFWAIFGCFGLFWGVLRCFEVFWGVLRSFWGVLRSF